MSEASELLVINAELSLAAYAILDSTELLETQRGVLLVAGMVPLQADAFIAKYNLIHQFDDSSTENTGFSVTVFQEKDPSSNKNLGDTHNLTTLIGVF